MDCHQLISYSIAQSTLIYSLLNHNLNLLPPKYFEPETEPETQNRLPTLKPADAVRIRTNEEKTWDKKESIIARNDRPRSCNVLNKNGNLIIRNRGHLIPKNEKFIVKHDYENIIEPSETTSRKTVVPPRTDIPSNVAAPSVRKSLDVLLGNQRDI